MISRSENRLRKGILYRVYTRELGIELSILYTKTPWSVPYYFSLSQMTICFLQGQHILNMLYDIIFPELSMLFHCDT